jgi:hypothetical protein
MTCAVAPITCGSSGRGRPLGYRAFALLAAMFVIISGIAIGLIDLGNRRKIDV